MVPLTFPLLIFLLLSFATSQNSYKKVVHNYDPEAKCLDGSPSLLYVHEGDPKKIMIFFLGGGNCGDTTLEKTLESCYQRSKDYLGTSTVWPNELPDYLAQGYLSLNSSINAFANWTKFFLPYCDGSLHQGFNKEAIRYKGTSLFFRGAAITRGHLNWIEAKYGLRAAEKVILTGMSAGGIAVNSWNNYVKELVGDPSKVYTISDSGVFLNYPTTTGQRKLEKEIRNIFKLANSDEPTPSSACNNKYPGQQWRCLFIENTYPFIQGPFLILNSEYDSWTIPQVLNIHCLKNGTSGQTLADCTEDELSFIEQYRQQYLNLLSDFNHVHEDLSIWSIGCSNHVYAFYNDFYDNPKEKVPAVIGKTVRQVVELFVLSDKRTVLFDDPAGWPSNTGCAY